MFNIYNDDCFNIFPTIKDHSIDLICCDLPYGVTANEWDTIIPMDKLWNEYNRVIKKNHPILLFAAQPFTTLLINSNIKKFNYCWYWKKNVGTNFFHAKHMPIRKIEEICVFNDKGVYYPQKSTGHIPTNSAKGCSNGKNYYGSKRRNYTGGDTTRYPSNILEYACVDNYSRQHPNQKPVALLEYLIRTYTNEGDLVLDNCMGSGTCGVACKNLNRNFIGIEKDADYYNIAKQRIDANIATDINNQTSLF